VTATRRIVVALSGASGAIYGIRALEALRADPSVEIHAIVSKGARATIEYETDRAVADVLALAHVQYEENDLAAALASGSFITAGMLVAPCSIRTMSAIAHSMNDNLIVRAADVHLKERRPLVLMVRETPLHAGHLKSMHELSLYGAVILPPVPGFYILPKTIDDLVDHSVGKALDQLGVAHDLFPRWTGPAARRGTTAS
jgi:4-hydroxy-3-polyprenylbenzoate decarboxylase